MPLDLIKLFDDPTLHILKFLTTLDLINLRRTCKRFRYLIEAEKLCIKLPKEKKDFYYILDSKTYIHTCNLVDEDENYINDPDECSCIEVCVEIGNTKKYEKIDLGDYEYDDFWKYALCENIVFGINEHGITGWDLGQEGKEVCTILENVIDFGIFNDNLIVLTPKMYFVYSTKNNFPFIRSFSNEEFGYYKSFCGESIYYDFDSVKIYNEEIYIFTQGLCINVWSVKEEKFVRTFKSCYITEFPEKNILFFNNLIYFCSDRSKCIHVFSAIDGKDKWTIKFPFKVIAGDTIHETMMCPKSGKIMISSYDGIYEF